VKAVFDSNIYISAFVFPGGSAERAILRILDGQDSLIVSKPIIDEVLRVLAEKFDRNAEELARTALFVSELAAMVSPKERLSILSDEPDNRILECAVEGSAEVIVTGDKAMLELGIFQEIQIQTLRRYLARG
jgi:putative PIN family toxin of toxin-antitoxin system